MIVSTSQLLSAAEAGGYSIGAFNIYNLEGVKGVLAAAKASPIMLQIHPSALKYGGLLLIALSLEAARQSQIPAVLHLDHSNSVAPIQTAIETGFGSIMADGSHLEYTQNINFTRQMAELAHGLTARPGNSANYFSTSSSYFDQNCGH